MSSIKKMTKKEEEFLYHIADLYGVGLKNALFIIDKCIKNTAAERNCDYSLIYDSVFSHDNLVEMLASINKTPIKNLLGTPIKQISNEVSDVKSCVKSPVNDDDDYIVIPPYGRVSKTIPNAKLINADPDKYVQDNLGNVKDLRKMVEIAAYLYYNFDGGGLTDNSFDALEWHLKKKEKIAGRNYDKIGAAPVEKIRKKLTYALPSVMKVKPDTKECNQFLNLFDDTYTVGCLWSLKLDGVSGSATYKKGKLIELVTRGDGIEGGDITELAQYIKDLPSTLEREIDIVVRGEFILDVEVWEQKYKDTYSNPRAFVSGKINSGYVSPALQDIQFISYGIMRENLGMNASTVPKPSQAKKILSSLGFITVEYNLFPKRPTTFDILVLYKEKRKSSRFKIDGLILEVDLPYPASLDPDVSSPYRNPSEMVAFKAILDDQIRATKVINVDWRISRYGKYIPVVKYESVFIDGNRLTKATAHNAQHIQDWSMGVGTKIKIARSGDVIPQIKDVTVEYTIEPIFPITSDQGGYAWHWNKSDIILDDIVNNKEVHIKQIVHFFETLNVPKLREKTVEHLYGVGFTTAESIVSATAKDLTKAKGIAIKSGTDFYNSIRETIIRTPPDRFMDASTSFESGIGRKLLRTIFKYIPKLLDMNEVEIATYFKNNKIPGFGPVRVKAIVTGVPTFRKYLDSFAKEEIKESLKAYYNRATNYNELLKNKKFVTTNFLNSVDYELEDYIYNNSGEFVETVTSDVSAVIYNNMSKISSKMEQAQKLGIPVLSIREFSSKYNVDLKRFRDA